jgi:hypothetical protein
VRKAGLDFRTATLVFRGGGHVIAFQSKFTDVAANLLLDGGMAHQRRIVDTRQRLL